MNQKIIGFIFIAVTCQALKAASTRNAVKCEGPAEACAYTIYLKGNDSTKIKFAETEQKALKSIARDIVKSKRNLLVAVQGHVFSVGQAEKEMLWSDEIAQAARQSLVSNGVSITSAQAVGYGAEKRRFEPANRKENLRIVIEVQDLDTCGDVMSGCVSGEQ